MARTRIAPSPTGEDLHIGNLYTALINWAVAKKAKGKFIVRIEDTDRQRLLKGSEQTILKTLKEYGLDPDESPNAQGQYGPYRQSQRLQIYQKYAQELIDKGHAYRCYCSKDRLDELRKTQQAQKKLPKYDKHCLKLTNNQQSAINNKQYVIRLNVPVNNEVFFEDLIRGQIKFSTNDIDDQILIKSDGFPTYHLAVVVDDYLMKISHVIRAEEWISSTPKHILLYEALGFPKPIFAHLPILRNPDRSKLSKRKNPVWASWYLSQGFLPEAVLNYLALMGWSHPQQKEIFSMSEFIEVFDLKDMQSVGPIFDVVKLKWLNGEYIRKTSIRQLADQIFDFFKGKYDQSLVEKTIPLIQERIKTLKEYDDYCRFFIEKPKTFEIDISEHKSLFTAINNQLLTIDNASFKADIIGQKLQETAEKEGISNSKFFMLLRVAITGKKITPPLNESMEILGKQECVERIERILSK